MEIIIQEFETPTVDGQGNTVSLTKSSAKMLIEPLEKPVVLEMAFIPGGIFKMGSPGRQGYEDEHPHYPGAMAGSHKKITAVPFQGRQFAC